MGSLSTRSFKLRVLFLYICIMKTEKNQGRIPLDMREGSQFGLLTLTGEWKVDRHQARRYEAICECGGVVYRCCQEIRKSVCCSKKKHPELRKNEQRVNTYNNLKGQYVGETLHNHTVLDVVMDRKTYRFVLKCLHCGRIVERKTKKFINGEVKGCMAYTEEDKVRVYNSKLKESKATNVILKEQRKKERLIANRGMERYKDLSGQKFGKLLVIEYVGYHLDKSGLKTPKFKCKCDCGEVCEVTSSSLKAGRKLCDKELLEFKREQGREISRVRRDKSIAEGRYEQKSFRRNNQKNLQKFSKLIYNKYNGVCQKCKQIHPKLISHAHHTIPVAQNKNLAFTLSNGILLCEDCHEEFHQEYGYVDCDYMKIWDYIKPIKQKGSKSQ